MAASISRIEANRRNAKKSRGPTTEEGKTRSRGNAVSHGLTGDGVALPASVAELAEQIRADLVDRFGAEDQVEHSLVAMAAVSMARMSRCAEVEEEQRRAVAERASLAWDLDRRAEVAALGARLGRAPARVAAELARSAPGCSWMIERWEGLALALDRRGAWDDAQRRLAADLLGIPAEFREADPRLDPDRPASELAEMVRSAIDTLRDKQAILDALDEADQSRATSGLAFDVSTIARRLQQYDAANFRRLVWVLDALDRHRSGGKSVDILFEKRERPSPSPSPSPSRLAPDFDLDAMAPTVLEPAVAKRTHRPEPKTIEDVADAEDADPSPTVAADPSTSTRSEPAVAKRAHRTEPEDSEDVEDVVASLFPPTEPSARPVDSGAGSLASLVSSPTAPNRLARRAARARARSRR